MNYENFIEYLKTLESTEEIVIRIYNYFRDNVKYNYDILQWHKIFSAHNYNFEKLINLKENYKTIYSYAESNFEKMINELDIDKEKEYAIKVLDEFFMENENRPLSNKVKEKLFEKWGTVEHVEPKQKNVNSRIVKVDASNGKPYDKLLFFGDRLLTQRDVFPTQYKNDLLIEGVCADYAEWMQKVCNDLNITCYQVEGKGTAEHVWNLIYIKEQDKWAHFDMTCVRFYLDNFTRDFGEPDKWVFASTEDIFKMQPKREIHSVKDYEGNIVFEGLINKDNYQHFENFVLNELQVKNGRIK